MTSLDREMEQHLSFNVYEHLNDEELQELNTWLDHIDAVNDEIEEGRRSVREYLTLS